MARNDIFISATPREVFELLSDPRAYAEWVAGSRDIHAADAEWPAAGSAFDHSSGPAQLAIRDYTDVSSMLAPVMLELRARARPLGTARVILQLHPEGNGTRVTMIEEPASRVASLLIGPLGHGLIRIRNRESLRRLKALAEGYAPRPTGPLPPRERSRR